MKNTYTIGTIADTHDVSNPPEVVALLGHQSCDYNVHLGDVGGSQGIRRIVREFKRSHGDPSSLPPDVRERFMASIRAGGSMLWAFIEAKFDKTQLPHEMAETLQAYTTVMAEMSRLPNAFVIKGNVDGLMFRNPELKRTLDQSPLKLTFRPEIIDLDWLAIVLWPSWRTSDPEEIAELDRIVKDYAARLAGKEHIVFLAHEHCFKGPVTPVYTSRMARAGLQELSVPRFNSSPTWRHLLCLFRALAGGAEIHYVFGHIHDPDSVIRAGVPSLCNPDGPGLRYRLYGLSWKGTRRALRTNRAEISMLPVGIEEVGVLGLQRDCTAVMWRAVPRVEVPR